MSEPGVLSQEEDVPAEACPPGSERDQAAARQQESARRKLYLAGHFYARLAEASAAAFRAFSHEVESDRVAARSFPHSLVLGLTQGHLVFVQGAVKATSDLLNPPNLRD